MLARAGRGHVLRERRMRYSMPGAMHTDSNQVEAVASRRTMRNMLTAAATIAKDAAT
ncbi:hypothetical protein SAMN05192564_102164 [Paraburkholderia sartisoli]|uniref:Uncharacterized protein n=1 Tax=Paraburkholderia sartisoli TaxID=83784 RepID=A0A1H4C7S7_9BURK|nr:hypothetical protein SAMN05192564_102164 [Paraburkholderia sartisoli]